MIFFIFFIYWIINFCKNIYNYICIKNILVAFFNFFNDFNTRNKSSRCYKKNLIFFKS